MTATDQTSRTTPEQNAPHVAGSPAWVDLSTSDIDGAKTFYSTLFGWTFENRGEEFGNYHYILRDGAPVGGLMSTVGLTCPEGGQIPTEWGVYLTVPDIESASRTTQESGGRLVVPAMPVGDAGSMAVAIDPAGAVIGMWQPAGFAGFEFSVEPGSPVWCESMTQDIDAALPFYREVFGWEIHEMPGEWRYATNGAQESATAGIGDARGVVAEGTPSYWRVYLSTANLDDDLERIPTLGGAVLDGPADSPYGRIATVQDPQGASFQLLQPPSE